MTLILENISYAYPGSEERRLILGRREFAKSTAVAVIGGNGTGKTTILNIIAGLLKGFSGSRVVPTSWRIALVPTALHHFLLPWYSAEQNLSFYATGGKELKLSSIKYSARDLAELLGRNEASSLLKRPVYELSTGERAALALLCSLSRKPDVLLLDELFANASMSTADRMLIKLRSFKEAGGLIIFTTHQKSIASELASQFIDLENHEMVIAK